MRAQINSPTYEGGLWSVRDTALVHPAKLADSLLGAVLDAGVEVFEATPVLDLRAERDAIELRTRGGVVRADRVALATNAFPSLLKRYRLHTVPVYDYVLMTEPLTTAQLASIGWEGRQGVADSANQFHYYRLSADNRILWGGYDAIYHYGGRIRSEYDDRRASFETLASHFFTTFPQLEGVRFTHRWAGVIDTSSRFCAFHATAHGGPIGARGDPPQPAPRLGLPHGREGRRRDDRRPRRRAHAAPRPRRPHRARRPRHPRHRERAGEATQSAGSRAREAGDRRREGRARETRSPERAAARVA